MCSSVDAVLPKMFADFTEFYWQKKKTTSSGCLITFFGYIVLNNIYLHFFIILVVTKNIKIKIHNLINVTCNTVTIKFVIPLFEIIMITDIG